MEDARRIQDLDALFEFSSDNEPEQSAANPKAVIYSSDDDVQIVPNVNLASDHSDNGLDPIKEIKKRPKIDAERLIGPQGFPNLVERSRKWKFPSVHSDKKKTDTMKDIKALLYEYELWCHTFFPKNKFEDTVKRVEKVCRTRRVQTALSDWKNAEKDRKYKRNESTQHNIDGQSDPELGHNNDTTQANQTEHRNLASDTVFESSPPPNQPHVQPVQQNQDGDEFPDEDEWREMQEMEEQHNFSSSKRQEVPLFMHEHDEDEMMT